MCCSKRQASSSCMNHLWNGARPKKNWQQSPLFPARLSLVVPVGSQFKLSPFADPSHKDRSFQLGRTGSRGSPVSSWEYTPLLSPLTVQASDMSHFHQGGNVRAACGRMGSVLGCVYFLLLDLFPQIHQDLIQSLEWTIELETGSPRAWLRGERMVLNVAGCLIIHPGFPFLYEVDLFQKESPTWAEIR